jgi:CRP-like cAMP-binding protein
MFGRKAKADAEWLRGVSFFDGFSDDELARVAALAEEVDAAEGAELTVQGRTGDVCYVVVDGTAGVYHSGDYVTSISEGSMVGETALIEHAPRNATVVAESAMVLAAFDPKSFRQLLEEMPVAKERVMTTLEARLKN